MKTHRHAWQRKLVEQRVPDCTTFRPYWRWQRGRRDSERQEPLGLRKRVKLDGTGRHDELYELLNDWYHGGTPHMVVMITEYGCVNTGRYMARGSIILGSDYSVLLLLCPRRNSTYLNSYWRKMR